MPTENRDVAVGQAGDVLNHDAARSASTALRNRVAFAHDHSRSHSRAT